MTLTLNLPAELESDAIRIPDLNQRLTSFVRQQVDLEKWRSRRYSDHARRLATESAEDAEKISREEASKDLLESYERISRYM